MRIWSALVREKTDTGTSRIVLASDTVESRPGQMCAKIAKRSTFFAIRFSTAISFLFLFLYLLLFDVYMSHSIILAPDYASKEKVSSSNIVQSYVSVVLFAALVVVTSFQVPLLSQYYWPSVVSFVQSCSCFHAVHKVFMQCVMTVFHIGISILSTRERETDRVE